MFFLFINKIFKLKHALISTLLLTSSQAFLLYGRSATTVGPTIFAEMATVIVLYYGILFKPSVRILSLAAFLLVSNSYFYAPIRFFSPLLVFVILRQLILLTNKIVEKFQKTSSKTRHNIIWLWMATMLIIAATLVFLHKPVFRYYNARGEQMVTLAIEKNLSLETARLVVDQFKRNIIRFGQLLLAINTHPASIDFSSLGQLVSRWLSPFFFIGILVILRKKTSKLLRQEYWFVFFWYALSAIPILFSNNVHIGRLFLSLPPMYLIIGIGVTQISALIEKIGQKRTTHLQKKIISIFTLILISILIGVVGFQEVSAYYMTTSTTDHNIKVLKKYSSDLENKTVILANFEPITLHFWEMYYFLQNTIYFEDSATHQPVEGAQKNRQSSDGILIRDGKTYTSYLERCNDANTTIITIGGSYEQHGILKPNCQAKLIELYQQ